MVSRYGLIGVGVLLFIATPALAAAFEAQLDPAPFDASNRADVINGTGHVTATLDGDTLRVQGDFTGLSSPAVGASVRIGLLKGVPGDAIGALVVKHVQAGEFSGSLKLNPQQSAAMKKQALYVRIDSELAPDGSLQGWLEGTH